jgi:Zn-dependent protease with chaperone function
VAPTGRLALMLASHPPIAERISRLRGMAFAPPAAMPSAR